MEELADKYNTAYTTRSFRTTYGPEVKVSGSYGWRINKKEETAQLLEILKSGESQVREPVYFQKAASYEGNDYGNTYAEVNLTAQHMFFYKDGQMVLESDFVSGNQRRNFTTPPGIFGLTYKAMPARWISGCPLTAELDSMTPPGEAASAELSIRPTGLMGALICLMPRQKSFTIWYIPMYR